ncbi:MAG: endonuclease/exonuclease/phosphatase family protein [Bacteroidaceae bacterium]|nr:endonuclease/exonuclease/phosphatase family protein [Bacteroidaceae bacterium]
MKLLKKIPLFIFIAINLLFVVAMIFCAYTSMLPPQDYPKFSYFGLMFPVFLAVNILFVLFWLVFKWKCIIIPVVGMLLCAQSIRAYIPINVEVNPPAGCLKVLSYNVMSFGDDKSMPWEENPIVQYLAKSDADFICLQEATNSYVEKAFASLENLYPYRHIEKDPDSFVAFLSKYPIVSSKRIDYESINNCSIAYEVAVEGDTVVFINNHLESYRLSPEDKEDYRSIIRNYKNPEENHSETKYISLTEKLSMHDSIRGIQTDSLAKFIEGNKHRPMIVCGDFNTSPISYTHRRLTEYLNDAYTRTGNGVGNSYNRSGMYFRIDNILVSPDITPYGAIVDKSIKTSDHYPIFCFIKWKE